MSKQLRVLHFAHGLASYNNSLLELANRLDAAGMTLRVVSHIDLTDVLREAPCDFQHLKQGVLLVARQAAERNMMQDRFLPLKIARIMASNHRYRRESLQSFEVDELIASWQPDLLLIDMECHVALLQTRRSGLPTLLCSRWFSVFRSPHLPPMHTALLPPRNLYQRWCVRKAWVSLAVYKRFLDFRFRLSRRRFRPIDYNSNNRFDLVAVARQCGIELDNITQTGHWLIPHVYKELPVMSLTARGMEFEQASDPRMHYVGAMVYRRAEKSLRAESALAEFEQFLSVRRPIGNPLIYCSFSTFWVTDEARIKPFIELFSNRPDIDLVMGLGGGSLPDSLSLPDNILMLEFAPQLEVMRFADVVITHGGISSINEALSCGVPLLGVSGRQVDQNGCLARLQYHGLGVLVGSDMHDTDEIMSLVDFLLSDAASGIRDNVKQIQAQLEAYEQQACAVELLRDIARPAHV